MARRLRSHPVVPLREVLAHLRPGGTLPWEAPAARLSLPDDIGLAQANDGVADHLLPVVLKPAEKRMLDCLADWPLATIEDLSGILCLSDSRTWRLTARLAPYLHYSFSNRPLDDHGERLLALIVFEDSLTEANFLGGARREMGRT